MSIVVLLEPDPDSVKAENHRVAVELLDGVRAVHAAPADPDVVDDPAELTFCGRPTGG